MSFEDIVRQIKDAPISSIIGQYIPLEKRGHSITALCPFHTDTKPSLHVSDSKQLFKCFACQVGGDAITFVQKYKNLEFKETLKEIGRNIGVNTDALEYKEKLNPHLEMARRVLSKTLQIYRKVATQKEAPLFLDFLKNRQLKIDIAEKFQLGFAPSGNIIANYFQSISDSSDRDHALKMALELGLIKPDKRDPKSYYDTFRERIMFPIWDQFGHLQGFTSRSIREDQIPKYLNSKESFVFDKKNLLYGLNFAKPYIRERDSLILCEGNMDVIALFQHGFENALGVMGTALNEYGLALIKNLTHEIYFALDSDAAGMKAMERSSEIFHSQGILPKFIDLTPFKDPDDLLKAEGPVAMKKRMDDAKTFLDVMIASLIPEKNPETVEEKQKILMAAFAWLSPLKMALPATERAIQVAKNLGLHSGAEQIINEYQSYLEANKRDESKKRTVTSGYQGSQPNPIDTSHNESTSQSSDESQKTATITVTQPELTRCEISLLRTITEHPSCFSAKALREVLDLLQNPEVKRYIERLQGLYYEVDEGEFQNLLAGLLDTDDFSLKFKEVVGGILFSTKIQAISEEMAERLLGDLVIKVKKEAIKKQKAQLKALHFKASSGDEVNSILIELNEVQKKLNEINNRNTHIRNHKEKDI